MSTFGATERDLEHNRRLTAPRWHDQGIEMSTWTKEDLRRQLHGSKHLVFPPDGSLYDILHDSAERESLPFALVLAVGSRETNLSEPYVSQQAGDNHHGYGALQLDNRSHHIPADWRKHPGGVILLCCELLRDLTQWSTWKWPELTGEQHVKIALSAYNAGRTNALRGHARGDSDRYTTGGDYGRDVLARERAFSELLAGQ